ncbi:GNAT family acetyltransferase [Serinicoccus chungangensis]|uniref:GNAT family acetyltransferase n=2 Tax=Serinicoccus chungangensis TaxID=767452 RepID=A0A0W8ICF0_9MICO|nr:GNAT family acetyltransferase [Serinicoccus chungangensis]
MLPQVMPTLSHQGVQLRAFEEQDVPLIQSVADDDLIPLITTVPRESTRAAAMAYIARQHERLRSGVGYSFAIVDTRTDHAVGQIGLWVHNIHEGRASTGYWIAAPHRRRGHLVAALTALTDWALRLDDVHRLELHVEPWNQGSWRAAERCGYLREGLLRSWQQVGTQRRDMYVYSALPHRDARRRTEIPSD